tara:strand:+ start:763 stop:1443 length:681 start_codon:yes stop_codon:yes gene_type:complete
MLSLSLLNDPSIVEIGVDETGRGPLFGRLYTAAVILPKDNTFDVTMVKDSKKFTSHKKLMESYNYILENATAIAVSFQDAKTIDIKNIRIATLESMHTSIHKVINQYSQSNLNLKQNFHLLIDGCDFKPFSIIKKSKFINIPHTCVEKGDNTFAAIAAASIVAKVERDQYISELCETYPALNNYALLNNKGYGTKKHLDAIKEFGVTQWHRTSFNRCKGERTNHIY